MFSAARLDGRQVLFVGNVCVARYVRTLMLWQIHRFNVQSVPRDTLNIETVNLSEHQGTYISSYTYITYKQYLSPIKAGSRKHFDHNNNFGLISRGFDYKVL